MIVTDEQNTKQPCLSSMGTKQHCQLFIFSLGDEALRTLLTLEKWKGRLLQLLYAAMTSE
jgi:hypothetical protein